MKLKYGKGIGGLCKKGKNAKERNELGEGGGAQEEKEEDWGEEEDLADKWDYSKGKTSSAYFHVVSRKKKNQEPLWENDVF